MGSCQNSGGAAETSANPPDESNESAEIKFTDSLPADLNFNGEILNFYTSGGGTADFYAEEETGDIIQDAIYRRNVNIEERLNIKINLICEDVDTWGYSPVNKVRGSILAGDNSYDLIIGHSVRWPALSLEGYLSDIYSFPYIKLSEPWWNGNATEQFTICGKLNFAIGDISKSFYHYTSALLVNKTILREYNLPDLYEVVIDGKWHLDYMSQLVKNIYRDIDGNGVADENDQYGLLFQFHTITTSVMDTCDAHLIKFSPDGYPRLDPDYEKLVSITEKLYELAYNNPGVIHDIWRHEVVNLDGMFLDDRGLLYPWALGGGTTTEYRKFEELGLIPFPKYDEKQEKYYSSALTSASLMCVPIDCKKPEITGAFMEAAASDGYFNIIPLFFDTVMKVKVARDAPTEKMIDIIRDGAVISFEKMYNLAISEVNYAILYVIGGNSTNLASWYEMNESKIETALDILIKQMGNIN